MISTIRLWLIRLIAGRDMVAVNLVIDRNRGAAISVPFGAKLLRANLTIKNWEGGCVWVNVDNPTVSKPAQSLTQSASTLP